MMRLWSIHPQYLDAKGLVALWREGLLAKKVLENKTRGYRNHPQLDRFKQHKSQQEFIQAYLHKVCDEADRRGYRFDRNKLLPMAPRFSKVSVKSGQVGFEWDHLLKKLKLRSPSHYEALKGIKRPKIHPVFKITRGGIESWEIT